MNQERRKRISEAITNIRQNVSKLESIKDDEDDYRENIPENLQSGDAYQRSEECSDALQNAIDSIGEAADELDQIT